MVVDVHDLIDYLVAGSESPGRGNGSGNRGGGSEGQSCDNARSMISE